MNIRALLAIVRTPSTLRDVDQPKAIEAPASTLPTPPVADDNEFRKIAPSKPNRLRINTVSAMSRRMLPASPIPNVTAPNRPPSITFRLSAVISILPPPAENRTPTMR